jgi:Nickel responsive protein SCO4226-like
MRHRLCFNDGHDGTEDDMSVYMVERTLKGIDMAALAAAQRAAIRQAARMRDQGIRVCYIRSAFLPGDGRCMCLFEADSGDDVRTLNDAAKIPYESVVEAFDLTP